MPQSKKNTSDSENFRPTFTQWTRRPDSNEFLTFFRRHRWRHFFWTSNRLGMPQKTDSDNFRPSFTQWPRRRGLPNSKLKWMQHFSYYNNMMSIHSRILEFHNCRGENSKIHVQGRKCPTNFRKRWHKPSEQLCEWGKKVAGRPVLGRAPYRLIGLIPTRATTQITTIDPLVNSFAKSMNVVMADKIPGQWIKAFFKSFHYENGVKCAWVEVSWTCYFHSTWNDNWT